MKLNKKLIILALIFIVLSSSFVSAGFWDWITEKATKYEKTTVTCYDNIQNQDEIGIDCGGPCVPCPTKTEEILTSSVSESYKKEPTSPVTCTSTSLKGDLNKDNSINVLDRQILSNIVQGVASPPENLCCIDLNDDGTINILDITIFDRILNGEIDLGTCGTKNQCSDGTLQGECSPNKPNYCDNGNLVNNCQKCGCPKLYCKAGTICPEYTCQEDGSCKTITPTQEVICTSSSVKGDANRDGKVDVLDVQKINNVVLKTIPEPSNLCCVDLNDDNKVDNVDIKLVEDVALGRLDLGTCEEEKEACSDGTLYGECSTAKPLFCGDGALFNNCQACGCSFGEICLADGSCKSEEITCDLFGDVTNDEEINCNDLGCVERYLDGKNEPSLCPAISNCGDIDNDNLISSTDVSVIFNQLTQRGINCIDIDNDGYYSGNEKSGIIGADCDDNHDLVNPGNEEICFDVYDNDCNGEKDEGCPIPNCKEIIPGINDMNADRVNIVFAGVNFDSLENFNAILPYFVDYEGGGYSYTFGQLSDGTYLTESSYGLFSQEPFKSNKNKLNFWYVDEIAYLTVTTRNFEGCGISTSLPDYCDLPNSNTINLLNYYCRSNANQGEARVSSEIDYDILTGEIYPSSTSVFVHELGHSFGLLRDEYVESDQGSHPGPPNCAGSRAEAEQWWGDLVGQGTGDMRVDFFDGCSYVEENIRPNLNSIMKDHRKEGVTYGPVNERQISSLLADFSGANVGATNVMEITILNEAGDLSLEEVKYKADSFPDKKIPYEPKYKVEIETGKEKYEKMFSTKTIQFIDYIDEEGNPKGGSEEIEIRKIKVFIPVGDSVLTKDGTKIITPEKEEKSYTLKIIDYKENRLIKSYDSDEIKKYYKYLPYEKKEPKIEEKYKYGVAQRIKDFIKYLFRKK